MDKFYRVNLTIGDVENKADPDSDLEIDNWNNVSICVDSRDDAINIATILAKTSFNVLINNIQLCTTVTFNVEDNNVDKLGEMFK